jgi:hypothetical protein
LDISKEGVLDSSDWTLANNIQFLRWLRMLLAISCYFSAPVYDVTISIYPDATLTTT